MANIDSNKKKKMFDSYLVYESNKKDIRIKNYDNINYYKIIFFELYYCYGLHKYIIHFFFSFLNKLVLNVLT